MKKLILFTFLISYSISAQNLYKGFNVGMTKKEAKSEFKKNKNQYIAAKLGSYEYRLYTQNNVYDDGGLTMIRFTPKGYGLGMMPEDAKLYFTDMIRLLENTGFSADGTNVNSGRYKEFKVGNNYVFHNKEKGKSIYLAVVAYGKNSVILNVMVGKFSDTAETDYSDDNSF